MSPSGSTLWKDALVSWNMVLVLNKEASKCPVFSTNWYSLVGDSNKKLLKRITKIVSVMNTSLEMEGLDTVGLFRLRDGWKKFDWLWSIALPFVLQRLR